MSLATDILHRSGLSLMPTQRQPTAPSVATIPNRPPHKPKDNPRKFHLARIHGLYRHRGEWRAEVWADGKLLSLGVFPTIERALIARKIWYHWVAKGINWRSIPRLQLSTAFQRIAE